MRCSFRMMQCNGPWGKNNSPDKCSEEPLKHPAEKRYAKLFVQECHLETQAPSLKVFKTVFTQLYGHPLSNKATSWAKAQGKQSVVLPMTYLGLVGGHSSMSKRWLWC